MQTMCKTLDERNAKQLVFVLSREQNVRKIVTTRENSGVCLKPSPAKEKGPMENILCWEIFVPVHLELPSNRDVFKQEIRNYSKVIIFNH